MNCRDCKVWGSGGGGGNSAFGYEFTIFLDDWSGLKEQVDQIEQENIMKRLKGQA